MLAIYSDSDFSILIEKKKSKNIMVEEVNEACKELAAYKRPLHVVILDYTEMPLNRVEKQDYQALKNITKVEVDKWASGTKNRFLANSKNPATKLISFFLPCHQEIFTGHVRVCPDLCLVDNPHRVPLVVVLE